MNIVHFITTLDLGGAENQLVELCSELRIKGHRVSVVYLKGGGYLTNKLEKLGVEVFSLADLSFPIQICKARRILKRQKFQIVHAHLPRAEILCRLGVTYEKMIVSRHNCEPFWPNGASPISTLLSRWVLKRCEHLISISKSVQSYLINTSEIPSKCKNTVVHYGIRSYLRESDPKTTFRRQQKIKLLAVGRLVKQKNYELMFRSLAETNLTSFELTVCGEGPLEKDLKCLVKELGIESRVNFKGKVESIQSEYLRHDVLLHTSDYEGFGFVYLEALNFGLPIISSDNDAAKEILGSDFEGLFPKGDVFALANKLDSLNQTAILVALQSNNAAILSDFSSERMCEKILNIYEQAQV